LAFDVLLSATVVELGDQLELLAAVLNVTDVKRAEDALRQNEALLNEVGRIAKIGGWSVDVASGRLTWTEEIYALCEVDEGFVPTIDGTEEFYAPECRPIVRRAVERAFEEGVPFDLELEMVTGKGRRIWVHMLGRPNPSGGPFTSVSGTFQDITERRKADEDRRRLQEQLSQAQRVESIGRLAGGVAHDFNNMLGVILGHAQLALATVDPMVPLHADLIEIQRAAERSADLTRQLLAFARQQPVAPVVLDVNAAVDGLLGMLRRLIGESIALSWLPGRDLCSVAIDPSQLAQVLTNLCVNARDAIEGVGSIEISTRRVQVDEGFCSATEGGTAGGHTVLVVHDDGRGMSRDVLERVFEPFFTTKEMGRGTGLGLATVYGIVKQNGGFIRVTSAPGDGTTFEVYLPELRGRGGRVQQPEAVPATRGGGETVLLVEDEPALLRLGERMLAGVGYAVLCAATPGEALRLALERGGAVDLVVTDVVMPEMNGQDLVERLRAVCPGVRCVFMSGYTADVIAHHGVLEGDVAFVQKPFTQQQLTEQVRKTLDAE
jgi:signal transduction histidine kinase